MSRSAGESSADTTPTGPAPRRMPATPVERWVEIAETSHDGIALLDARQRFRFASGQFASALGLQSVDVIGRRFDHVFTDIRDVDVLISGATLARPAQIEHAVIDRHGAKRFVRLMLIPRVHGGVDQGTILVQHDITAIRLAQFDRHTVQQRLTEVEDDEHRRISRDLHDGPIQLLTVLALRLGILADSGGQADLYLRLEQSIDAASRELRAILDELTPGEKDVPFTDKLTRWTAPLVSDTQVTLTFEDRTMTAPDPTTIEAMFVILFDAVAATVARPAERTVRVRLDEIDDSHKLVIVVDGARRESPSTPQYRAQVDAAIVLTGSLGGSFETTWEEPDKRTIIVTIPRLDEDDLPPTITARPLVPDVDEARFVDAVDSDSAMTPTDDDWATIAAVSKQGLFELDAQRRLTSVNATFAERMDTPAEAMIGINFEDLFAVGRYDLIRPDIDRLLAGEVVRLEWPRTNTRDGPRWIQVTASPRVDDEGVFAGALVATRDTTDIHMLRELQDSSRLHLQNARKFTEEWSVRRLELGPFQRLDDVAAELTSLVDTGPSNEPLAAIRDALVESVGSLRGSVQLRTQPLLADRSWSAAVLGSIAWLLDRTDIDVVFLGDPPDLPSDAIAATFARIAREAVANAVIHAEPQRVTVLLEQREGGYFLEVHDDGVGIDLNAVEPVAGHLGLRSMAERAAEQGGTFTIGRSSGVGTDVRVWIPHHT